MCCSLSYLYLVHVVMFGYHLLEAMFCFVFFPMRARKEVDLGRREAGEELEGTEGGTAIN